MTAAQLVAPFPYFGGKRQVARMVWERFGDVPNYVEPFFGSGAVLLGRPTDPRTETVNDLDGLLCNFWRAVSADPEAVARYADWPVSEADLSARHLELVNERAGLTAALESDPAHFDARLAGWWVWGACAWIGSGWCAGDGPWVRGVSGLERRNQGQGINRQLPHLGNQGQGINRQLPHLGNQGQGINRQLPHLGNQGRGINRQLPHMGDQGRGINRKLPHMGDQGRGINRKLPHMGDQGRGILEWMRRLSDRLRRVRVACGSWERVLGDSVTWRHGVTGVFLDPPYAEGSMDYSAGGMGTSVASDVAAWAREAGRRNDMRIALCGHEGEHDLPGWACVPWTARGGYGNQDNDDEADNRHREVVWFSPACMGPSGQRSLFEVTR